MSIAELLGARRKQVASDPGVMQGDYFYSSRHLYCVEQVRGVRALVEDCRTGDLLDVALDDLLRLRRLCRETSVVG